MCMCKIIPKNHSTKLLRVAQASALGLCLSNMFQAVLYLKNGIDRYWRKTAPNAISQQEKEEIKAKILQIYVQR